MLSGHWYVLTTQWTLQWRLNECDDVSNQRRLDYLLNRFSGADQSKHQSSASLAFVRGSHRSPMDFPHTGPATLKMLAFDDVILISWDVSTYPCSYTRWKSSPTYRCQMTHLCVTKQDHHCLSPIRQLTIISSNDGMLFMRREFG